MKINYFIGILIGLGILFSCKNLSKNSTEILAASYQMKTLPNSDQGYQVFLLIKNPPKDSKVNAILLNNKRFERIELKTPISGLLSIEQFLLVQTNQIQNFIPPTFVERSDGIVFEVENGFQFVEIDFMQK